jgi:hypothetical protein
MIADPYDHGAGNDFDSLSVFSVPSTAGCAGAGIGIGQGGEGRELKNGVGFEAHAAGISHRRGSWLACRGEILLNLQLQDFS